ncbi:MAG: DUF2884 family protein [Thermomonas sp.]|uniref:DUF2884 family protein n=1 Tax=Thermomonas sp. TaxID=1971895 RepID=UPI0039E25A8F
MNTTRTLAIALLATIPLLGCNVQRGDAETATRKEGGFIAEQVNKAMDEARKELATENISLNEINVRVNGRRIRSLENDGRPKAEISPQGDLLIDDKAVAINDAQRKQLLAYRGQIIGIAEAGMAIGSKGVGIADTALSGVAGLIFGGEEERKAFEQKIEAEAKKLETDALKLCAHLPAMLTAQQALAESLPEFKPYATMTQEDVDDCGKDAKSKGVAVTDDDRHRIRNEIRNGIRQGIRETVQAVTGGSADDEASAPAR